MSIGIDKIGFATSQYVLSLRRQRQMCIRDRCNQYYADYRRYRDACL